MPRARSNKTSTLRTGYVSNVEELQKIFNRVPAVLIGGMKQVVTAALLPYASEMRKNLGPRKRSGLLAKSIKVRVVQFPSGVAFGIVGPARDVVGEYRGKRVVPANYAHLVEFGTKPHALKRVKTGSKTITVSPGGNRKDYERIVPVYADAPGTRRHPGAKPYPFRGPALAYSSRSSRAAENKLERLYEKALKEFY